MPWNHMAVELIAADALIRPEIGPGGYTREQARAQVRGILLRLAAVNPAFMKLVRIWLEDYAATIRRAGVDVSIAKLPA